MQRRKLLWPPQVSLLLMPLVLVIVTGSLAWARPAVLSHVAHSDGVKALLDYKQEHAVQRFIRFQIFRHGEIKVDGPIPGEFDSGIAKLQVRDIDLDGEPEILLQIFTAEGPHCCFGTVIYGFDRAVNTYRLLSHQWGNSSPAFRDLNGDGKLEFEGTDDEFSYKFGSFAESGAPIEIWRYLSVTLQNVTSCYPALIEKDAEQWWARAQIDSERYSQFVATGYLAAFAADQCLLKRCQQGLAKIRTSNLPGVHGSYIDKLSWFLIERGYWGPYAGRTSQWNCGAKHIIAH